MAFRLITGRLQQGSKVCRTNLQKEYCMRYTKLHKMFATTCGIAQTALIHYTRGLAE